MIFKRSDRKNPELAKYSILYAKLKSCDKYIFIFVF